MGAGGPTERRLSYKSGLAGTLKAPGETASLLYRLLLVGAVHGVCDSDGPPTVLDGVERSPLALFGTLSKPKTCVTRIAEPEAEPVPA